jgi:hypothetical protein
VLTVRAIAAGLLVGAVLCFSNTYFGLQTGWVTMGSLQVRAQCAGMGGGCQVVLEQGSCLGGGGVEGGGGAQSGTCTVYRV